MNKGNDQKENKSDPKDGDPDLILMDRVLTKTGGMVFPPRTQIPEATDEEVARLMKVTEHLRTPNLLNPLASSNTHSPTTEPIEPISNPIRWFHFTRKKVLAIAAVLAIFLGIGLRSLFVAPPSSFAVVIDFSPSYNEDTDSHINNGAMTATGVALGTAVTCSKGSGRSRFITGAIAVGAVIAGTWDSHTSPFLARIASIFPDEKQELIQTGVIQALEKCPETTKARFFYFREDVARLPLNTPSELSRSLPLVYEPPSDKNRLKPSVFTQRPPVREIKPTFNPNKPTVHKIKPSVARLISKEQYRNVVYVTKDPMSFGLRVIVFEAGTKKQLAEAFLRADKPEQLQTRLQEKISEWITSGVL